MLLPPKKLLFLLCMSTYTVLHTEPFTIFSRGTVPPVTFKNSEIAQFCYTSEKNIGDYLPTLGMWDMLGSKTDLYSIMNTQIDFNFINKNYKAVIVGGAGILGKGCNAFFEKLTQECTLPIVLWGVGMCLRYDKPIEQLGLNKELAKKVEEKSILLNIRDTLTQSFYKFEKAEIAVCPAAVYASRFRKYKSRKPETILYVAHEPLVPVVDNQNIIKTIQENSKKFAYLNNLFKEQKSTDEIENVFKNYYCKSKLIVTTRLHGAIIAYGLGIPYIAIAYDEKLVSFHENYGNGLLVKNSEELAQKLISAEPIKMYPIQLKPALAFGLKAKKLLFSLL